MARRLILALIAALVISGLFTFWLSRRMAKPRAAKPLNDLYVAAGHPLNAGQVLQAEDLSQVEWPASMPLKGGFHKPQDLTGRSVLYPLAAGEPVLDRDLAAPGSGVGLTGKIPEGMRAIALRSDEVVGVAGFLLPGTHVDVLVTYRDNVHPEPVTATVLQDAKVLAAGHQYQPDPSGKPKSVDVVTLLLTPEDAEKAVLASSQGSIHFVLRNGSDHAQADPTPIRLSQLAVLSPATVASRPAPRAPKPWVVETLSGDKLTRNSFH